MLRQFEDRAYKFGIVAPKVDEAVLSHVYQPQKKRTQIRVLNLSMSKLQTGSSADGNAGPGSPHSPGVKPRPHTTLNSPKEVNKTIVPNEHHNGLTVLRNELA